MDLLALELELRDQVEPERGRRHEPRADRVVHIALGQVELRVRRWRAAEPHVLAVVERDLAGAPQRPGADPDELAAGGQLVEPGRAVGAEPAREHVVLPDLGRQRDALKRHEGLAQAVDAGAGGPVHVDVLPRGHEPGELRLIDGLRLLAQGGHARTADPAQHVGVAPLALAPAREQLPADELARAFELAQGRGQVDAVPAGDLGGRERAVGPRVAAHHGDHGVGHRLQERLRQPTRRRDAHGVAIQPGVLGRDPALLAGDSHRDGAALALELADHRLGREALRGPQLELGEAQVAQPAQGLLQRVAVARQGIRMQQLERPLDLLERLGIDELAELVGAEQLRQQVPVERQRGGPPLGVGRVALVHVGGDVVEEQRGGERRRGLRLDLHQGDLAGVQVAQQLDQRGQVEHVAQALAIGLEDHREAGEVLGDLEQALRLEALLPQRRALARVGARDQQAARGVLAEAGAEQRRAAELADDQVLDLVGLQHHEGRVGRLVGVGQVDRRSRRRTRSRPPRDRVRRGSWPTARDPTQRGRDRRRARARTGANRRSRRGTSPPPGSRPRARPGSPPAARAGR